MIDYSRFIDSEGVCLDSFYPRTYLTIFGQTEELADMGGGKRELQNTVAKKLYGEGITSAELRRKIDEDTERAKRGERIHCEGIGHVLFPDKFPISDSQLSFDIA